MLLTHNLWTGRLNLNTWVTDKKSAQTHCHLTPELVRKHELQLKDTYKRKRDYLNMITSDNKNKTNYLPGSKDMEDSGINCIY